MDTDTAKIIVKVYAVLAWLGAIISLVGAIGVLFFSSLAVLALPAFMASLGILFGILLVGFAVFEVIVGFGLWKLKDWARVASIVFSALSLFSFPIGTLIGAFGIWFFGFEPTAKGLFGAKTARVATKPAKAAKKKKK